MIATCPNCLRGMMVVQGDGEQWCDQCEVKVTPEIHRLRDLYDAWRWFLDNGWQDARHCPRDPAKAIDIIEPGSSGIHRGYRDETGFWVLDGELYPSDAILWRPHVK